jgi:hypothetical protein
MSYAESFSITEPIGASAAHSVLASVPTMPQIVSVTVNGLQMTVEFAEAPSASTVSLVRSVIPTFGLSGRKASIVTHMSESIRAILSEGFRADIVGQEYWYDTEIEDQINMLGAAMSAQLDPTKVFIWHVRPQKAGLKTPVNHTGAQIVMLGQAYAAYKENRIAMFQSAMHQVMAALDHGELDQIEGLWDPTAPWPAE